MLVKKETKAKEIFISFFNKVSDVVKNDGIKPNIIYHIYGSHLTNYICRQEKLYI